MLEAMLSALMFIVEPASTANVARAYDASHHNDESPAAQHRAEIERALLEVHNKQRNVGLAAAVLLHNKLVYSGCLGHADLEHQVLVKPQTRFGIASVTKAFTGIALLKLREAGRIDI